MEKTKDIILKLKKARNEKGLSYRNILALMEKNGDYLSKSTLSRVFSKESEEMSFRYEETICPIAKVLIDTDIIKIEDDLKNTNGKVLPEYIKELKEHIKCLEYSRENDKKEHYEELTRVRKYYEDYTHFLEKQIQIKDKRIDLLLEKVLQDRAK